MNEATDKILKEYNVDVLKWRNILYDFMMNAVKNIKPSSRYFNDSIDINKYIKVFLLEWKD